VGGQAELKLSTSLSKDVLQAVVGAVINRDRGGKRRYTLFFEEIFADYILAIENEGFRDESSSIARQWMRLAMNNIITSLPAKLPPKVFLNILLKNIWAQLGLMDDFKLTQQKGVVRIKTVREGVSRLIGPTVFLTGFYEGILNAVYGREVELTKCSQSKSICDYTYRLGGGDVIIQSKDKAEYRRLNSLDNLPEGSGVNLKKAIRNKMFQLRDRNRLYFRSMPVGPIESSVFHLFGDKEILLDYVPEISKRCFSNALDYGFKPGDMENLNLLKSIMEAMGWGIFRIQAADDIMFDVRNPPYGLQVSEDNWEFLMQAILGFIRVNDGGVQLDRVKTDYKHLVFSFRR
jgi:hypothetical protein